MLYIVLEGLIVFVVTYLFFKVTIYTPVNPKHKNDSVFYALFLHQAPKNRRLPGTYDNSFAVIVQHTNVSNAMQGIAK